MSFIKILSEKDEELVRIDSNRVKIIANKSKMKYI